MIRLAVSDLDNWVAYTDPAIENFEITTEQLIARLLRTEPPTEEMQIGSAFHSVMERIVDGVDLEYAEQDGYEFFFEADSTIALPAMREADVEKVYQTAVGPVRLRGRVDARTGRVVTDYKLTFSSFDAERYADSMQWRAYLDMLDGNRFNHLVFQGYRPGDRGSKVWIHEVHELVQWAYPQMGEDVARIVGQLAEFVAVHVPEKIVTQDQLVEAERLYEKKRDQTLRALKDMMVPVD